mgnify:CR=1 FL=1|jgi:membrane-associated phospholipid phosphatase
MHKFSGIILFLLLSSFYSQAFAQKSYETNLVLDIGLSVSALALNLWGDYRVKNPAGSDSIFSKSNLFIWDRPFAGVYNPKYDQVNRAFTLFAPFPLIVGLGAYMQEDIEKKELWTLFLMYVESIGLQGGVNLMIRSAKIWPRPYVYNAKIEHHKIPAESYGSFYSGHASAAFSIAILGSSWFQNTYPTSKYTPYFWFGSLSVASTVSVLRVASGKHYPTDIIVGALMGSLSAYTVLKAHEINSKSFSLNVFPGYIGFTKIF